MPGGFLDKLRGVVLELKGEKVLYYPGCMTRFFLPDLFDNYKSLLSDIGVDYVVINEFNCCGSPLLNAGYTEEFKKIKEKNLKILKRNNITKIITNCPHCYDLFKKRYEVRVEHITQVFERAKHKFSAENDGEVAYHDSCLLARKNNIIDEPRRILKSTGFKLAEPLRSKQNTFCCGAGGGVKQNSPKIANKIAKERLSHLKSKKIIVSCPFCFAHLSENADDKKKVVELSTTLVED